ncbi:helix-turn-helix domain-containing protein [Rhizobium tibeticum]|uniref:helix-turn-helix domain-containing protein n=1 Tax=Rhizobium tibeticum TaxID=501024 RepID=UPI001FCD1A0D|nr:helix-turn-helix domain-containing protein [Rhizobium tibeticum]
MTEPEVAAILRCSREKIKRLRLAGKLAYLPGRPVLIDEADLASYIEAEKARIAAKAEAAKPRPRLTETDARKWALEQVLLRRGRRKP